MATASAKPFPLSAARLRRVLLVACLAAPWAAVAEAQQTLLDGTASYTFTDQSMWGPGSAFLFDYTQFVGIDSNPAPVVVGSGSGDRVGVDTLLGTYSLDPYFQFDTDFKLGVELGASINSGSVDGSLDYAVSLSAPERIESGQAFALTGSATPLASSSFVTRAPTAQAYVDGILDTYVGGYARFDYVAPGVLADHDYRWGNLGFTDNNTGNSPYATVANINERQELVGVNRNQSGVVRYFAPNGDLFDGDLLYDQVGKGSSVSLGPISLTAGNIDVVANGTWSGSRVVGAGQDTLASMVLDIDHMLLGTPALGLSVGHDWGTVDYDLGYNVVDLDAGLDILLQQDFALDGQVLIDLVFSSDVLLAGIGAADHYRGPIDQIPLITLLGDAVDVDATVLVDAILSNDTSLGFVGSLTTTVLEAWASVGYDIAGATGSKGYGVGPVYDDVEQVQLGDISVYGDSFSLGQAAIGSWSFELTAVPEPGTAGLLAVGLLGLCVRGGRRAGPRAVRAPAAGAQRCGG
jgi:hypothetical protein